MDIQEKFYKAIKNNDINNVKSLLNDKRIDPSYDNNFAIQLASQNGHIDIVKLLLKDKRVDPSHDNNYIIRFAYNEGYLDIVNLLWQDQRVKNSLKNHNEELYNQLVKQNTKEKVDKF